MMKNKRAYIDPVAVAEYIKERKHFNYKIRGERAIKYGKIRSGTTVLDLCCGPGLVAEVIKAKYENDVKIVGIDISDDFIKYARDNYGDRNTDFITGNVEDLDKIVGDQKFDSILLLASWLWIKNKEKVLSYISTLISPSGVFVISISSDDLNDPKTKDFYWKYRENLKAEIKDRDPLADTGYFQKLPVIDDNFINKVVKQITGCGFTLKSNNEESRILSPEDKLFTYNNPARTEWVGDFSPRIRLEIIKKALYKTAKEIKGFSCIKRHTYYLVFNKSIHRSSKHYTRGVK